MSVQHVQTRCLIKCLNATKTFKLILRSILYCILQIVLNQFSVNYCSYGICQFASAVSFCFLLNYWGFPYDFGDKDWLWIINVQQMRFLWCVKKGSQRQKSMGNFINSLVCCDHNWIIHLSKLLSVEQLIKPSPVTFILVHLWFF